MSGRAEGIDDRPRLVRAAAFSLSAQVQRDAATARLGSSRACSSASSATGRARLGVDARRRRDHGSGAGCAGEDADTEREQVPASFTARLYPSIVNVSERAA
jgi:hypothetical protein